MIKLDARDFDILRALSREGRMSKARLAEAIGLSPTPAWERLKKLEKAGLIEGYHAKINLRKLGATVTVFVAAELADHTQASFRRLSTVDRHAVGRAHRHRAVFHLYCHQTGQRRRCSTARIVHRPFGLA